MKNVERDQKYFTGSREHLDVLLYALKKNDVDFWNTWRKNNREVTINLSGANLHEAHLPGADFGSVNLREADLHGAQLSNANFSCADLHGADLSETTLCNAEFSKAVLAETDLFKADCSAIICKEAQISGANFSLTNLQEADFGLSVITSADFTDADLCKCSLRKAVLKSVTLTGAYIYGWHVKGWKTENILCDYVYIDFNGKERLPNTRKFRSGEFEGYIKKLYAPKDKIKTSTPRGRTLQHVFISSEDSTYDFVRKLADAMEIHGIKVWLEKERLQPAVTWQRALKNAIDNGVYFIACFSESYSRKSSAGLKEDFKIACERLRAAPNDTTWFIPAKLLRCDIPDVSIGPGRTLKDLPLIDLSHGWNAGISRIVDIIKP